MVFFCEINFAFDSLFLWNQFHEFFKSLFCEINFTNFLFLLPPSRLSPKLLFPKFPPPPRPPPRRSPSLPRHCPCHPGILRKFRELKTFYLKIQNKLIFDKNYTAGQNILNSQGKKNSWNLEINQFHVFFFNIFHKN